MNSFIGPPDPADCSGQTEPPAPRASALQSRGIRLAGLGLILAALGVVTILALIERESRRIDGIVTGSRDRGEPATIKELVERGSPTKRSISWSEFEQDLERAFDDRAFDLHAALAIRTGSDRLHTDGERRFDPLPAELESVADSAVEFVQPEESRLPGVDLSRRFYEALAAGELPSRRPDLRAWSQLVVAECPSVEGVLARLPVVSDRDLRGALSELAPDEPYPHYAVINSGSPSIEFVVCEYIAHSVVLAIDEGDATGIRTLGWALDVFDSLLERGGLPNSERDLALDLLLIRERSGLLRLGWRELRGSAELRSLLENQREHLETLDIRGRLRNCSLGERLLLDETYRRAASREPGSLNVLGRFGLVLFRLSILQGRALGWEASEDLLARIDAFGLDLHHAGSAADFTMPYPRDWDVVGKFVWPHFGESTVHAALAERERRLALVALVAALDGESRLDEALDRWRDPFTGERFEVGADDAGRPVLRAAGGANFDDRIEDVPVEVGEPDQIGWLLES